MDYYTDQLPDHLCEGCDKGNWMSRNAKYRRAVCGFLNLRHISVNGAGNCFFEAVCISLRSVSIQRDLTAAQLRADVVQYLRLCPGSTQDLPERISMEMTDELHEPLVASNFNKFNGVRLNGFVPQSFQEYLDASACDGVWIRGLHWLRAISFLHEVRVAVVIYNQLLVRYIGSGEKTIHLYKVDADTHWDPLVDVAFDPPSIQSLPSALESAVVVVDSDSGAYSLSFCSVYTVSYKHNSDSGLNSSSDGDDVTTRKPVLGKCRPCFEVYTAFMLHTFRNCDKS